jgi:hypothetical protein
MGERAQHFADRTRGSGQAFPNASVVDRYAGQEKSCVAQPREIGSDELTPLLALATLYSEVGGNRSDVFIHGTGIHPDLSLQQRRSAFYGQVGTIEPSP